MIYDKLFKMSRFTREFLLWYLKRKEGGEWHSETLRTLFMRHRKIEAGKNSYGWAHDYINGPLKIGKYVSIGRNFRRISKNHPIDYITTHPCSFSPEIGWVKKDKRKRELLEIGNDVLIAPNSFVNIDVPDHSVVIGNPAVVHSKENATGNYVCYLV